MSFKSHPQRALAEVTLFKELLRCKTMHPNPDLASCVIWLRKQAIDLGMEFKTVTYKEGLPVVILTRRGTRPDLPAIGLNCHMDVVPVVAERWDKLPPGETPFTAWEDPATGHIYARGSQDMKCVGAQYLCALKRLVKDSQKSLLRTVHSVWVPDEEIGGEDGMKLFATSAEFQNLNIGVMMDEGLAFDENKFVIFTGERTAIWARFTAAGPVGHASKLIDNTAIDRLSRAMTRITAQRDKNVAKLVSNPNLKLGDVTTINTTVINGGTTNDGGKTFAPNVIPSDAFIVADIRVALSDYRETIDELKKIAADYNLTLTFDNRFDETIGPSPYSDKESVWMKTIVSSVSKWGAAVEDTIFPAATDSRYIRRAGVAAFGFSPMRNTPSLLHDHNEYLNKDVFVEGVDVMEDLIEQLASVPMDVGSKI